MCYYSTGFDFSVIAFTTMKTYNPFLVLTALNGWGITLAVADCTQGLKVGSCLLFLFNDNSALNLCHLHRDNRFQDFGEYASPLAAKSRITSINFAFSRIPYYISGQFPDPEKSLPDPLKTVSKLVQCWWLDRSWDELSLSYRYFSCRK